MKKSYLFIALAALAFASCANDDFVGGEKNQLNGETDAINFAPARMNTTRANTVGVAAAALLGNNFVVEGVKGDGTFSGYGATNVVFDHYNVNWKTPANDTESDTKGWEYVGQANHGNSSANVQTIKYWDYSQNQYDYVAFSYGTSDDAKLDFSSIDYTKISKAVQDDGSDAVYTVTGTAGELAKSYIADLVTLYNHDGVNEFATTVTPKFRRLGAKVRIAFYETVPGYSVGDVEFYDEAWNGTDKPGVGSPSTDPTLFSATAVFAPADKEGTMSIYYPTVGFSKRPGAAGEDSDYNQAHVVFQATTSTDMSTTMTFGGLNYTDPTTNAANTGNALGETSSTATYAGDPSADNAYYTVLPLGSGDNLQIRIKYTLYPDDGGSETIVVDNARAVVPAGYCEWNPNYAYTYIFKISDNTNGATGVDGDGNIVEGITPITFDAVVVETEDGIQETITTVATPSITTYQEGKVVTAGSEYQAGDVYVSVMNGTTPVTLTDSPANYAVYLVTAGEDKVNEAIAQDMLNGVKSNTGITWTPAIYEAVSEVPSADGNTLTVSAAKFAAASGKTYVFDVVIGGKNYVKVIRVQ